MKLLKFGRMSKICVQITNRKFVVVVAIVDNHNENNNRRQAETVRKEEIQQCGTNKTARTSKGRFYVVVKSLHSSDRRSSDN